MSLPWWRKLASAVRNNAHNTERHQRGRRRGFFRSLWVEHLEDRTLPSTYQWVGGSSANWNDPGNWNLLSGAGTFPNAPGDVAQFTGTPSGTGSWRR